MRMCIRLMNKEDIDDVLIIENTSFSTPWSREAFDRDMNNDMAMYLCIEYDKKVVAYAGFWKVFDEAHVTNVAVLPEYRGKGISKVLMHSLFNLASTNYINRMTLEVRESNYIAINLYTKLGFENCGKRPNYYRQPLEDAIIMWKELEGEVC